MKNFWYLPIAAAVGVTSLTVWGQANAGPPPEVSPGVVITADVTSGSGTAKTDDRAAVLSTPSPTTGITAIPGHTTQETQLVPAEPQTYAPVPPASPTHEAFDDKGGLRADNLSDDPPGDDKGGLRADNLSDDPPGDDKGGLRADNLSDDPPGDDKGGLRDDDVSDDAPGDDKGGDR
ncbi:hypothetical protein ACFVYC_11050 [Pseudarthrobacter sp. NPDC058329]|uniref:hypothetical protein n=1 Tax=Pseudarthrobacter sp. NPDC058329 TaxID=3346448 RepID=UPI0036DC2196